MLIEDYFQIFADWVRNCPHVVHSDIRYQARRPALGFIRGDIHFRDGSVLHVREFVDVEYQIERLTYAYQYMNGSGQLIFRFDNADHHRRLGLSTHPHHKHDGAEDRITDSATRSLPEVLQEIERMIRFI